MPFLARTRFRKLIWSEDGLPPARLFHFDGPESAFRRAGDYVRDALLAERQGYIMLRGSFPDPDIAVLEDNEAQS
jgi:hypothetical protein